MTSPKPLYLASDAGRFVTCAFGCRRQPGAVSELKLNLADPEVSRVSATDYGKKPPMIGTRLTEARF